MDILPENEKIVVDDGYAAINPEAALSEQQAFIDNYRAVANQNNAQTVAETAALGTDISSNLGGLGSVVSPTSYFTSRYSTPQVETQVANLRAAAQAQALNQVLSNELGRAKRAYQKRAAAAAYGSGSGSGGGTIEGGVNETAMENMTTTDNLPNGMSVYYIKEADGSLRTVTFDRNGGGGDVAGVGSFTGEGLARYLQGKNLVHSNGNAATLPTSYNIHKNSNAGGQSSGRINTNGALNTNGVLNTNGILGR